MSPGDSIASTTVRSPIPNDPELAKVRWASDVSVEPRVQAGPPTILGLRQGQKGRAGMQLTHTPDPTSSISMLVGQDAAQQKQVLADVRRALAALAREAGAP